jgi:hypothetical protein
MFCRRSPKLVALIDFGRAGKNYVLRGAAVKIANSSARAAEPSTWRSFSMNAAFDPKTRRVMHRTQIKGDERIRVKARTGAMPGRGRTRGRCCD